MIERIAADLIVLLHFGFIVFVGLGGFLALRWQRAAWLHVPAAAWGAAIELRRGICPLTPLEQRLRLAAGDAGYSGSFIEHYLLPIIYPSWLGEYSHYALGALVVVVNLAVYGWLLLRWRRQGTAEPRERSKQAIMPNLKHHHYATRTEWTGNLGEGTTHYRAYSRDHVISAAGRPELFGSSDPAFRGDASRWNPEDLLVASLSSCHMLWYLHLCALAKIVVLAYHDDALGTMVETVDGGGRFAEAVLRPVATLAPGCDAAQARALHEDAHRLCFIANSVNFPVRIEPTVIVAG